MGISVQHISGNLVDSVLQFSTHNYNLPLTAFGTLCMYGDVTNPQKNSHFLYKFSLATQKGDYNHKKESQKDQCLSDKFKVYAIQQE